MKKKILLSSIVTIALCLCMIAGSTFALFTDETDAMNVSVNSGDVEITAKLSGLELYSIVDADANTPNAERLDVFGSEYYFVEAYRGDNVTTFLNGGTAELTNNDSTLTLTNITPGDKVSFDIKGQNSSNVNTNVRFVINLGTTNPADLELADMLEITVTSGNGTVNGYLDANGVYTSDWLYVPQNLNNEPADIAEYFTVTVRFLPEADSEYENRSYAFNIVLQAVQANEEAPSNNGTVNP